MQANSCGIKLGPAKLVEIECHCEIGVLFEDLAFIFLFSFKLILILIFVFLTVEHFNFVIFK